MELSTIGRASSTEKQKNQSNNNGKADIDLREKSMAVDTESLTTRFDALNDNETEATNPQPTSTVSTPAEGTTPSKRISEFDAIQHLIKGNLGPGCLNIPHAFAMSGWILGLFLFALVAIQGIYSMVLLVYCKQWLRADQREQRRRQATDNTNGSEEGISTSESSRLVTFMDVAYATYGRAGSVCVQLLLFVLQAGVCCVFLSLIATNLHASVPAWDFEWCVCLVTLLLLVVVLIRDLKELKWLSLGANCLMVTAIGTAAASALWVLFGSSDDGGNDDGQNDGEAAQTAKKYTTNPAAIAAFVSSMFYSFEGIGLVMPVENSFVGYSNEEEEEDTTSAQSPLPLAGDELNEEGRNELRIAERTKIFVSPVLIGAMSTVAGLFLLIGATCGPAFPDIVDGSVTAYLTTKYPNSLWYQVVNAGVMVAVFLTFPLQLTPAMEVLRAWFGPGCDPVCCGKGWGNGSSGCCCGGGGLVAVRRRARGYGRHTIVAQSDVIDRGNDGFQDEDEAEATPGDGIMEHTSESPTSPAPPPRNSCFGRHEWIFRRFVVVFGCALVVLTVNDLGLLMSLFGALGNTGLAAMPCFIHWRLMQRGIAPLNFLLMAVDAGTIAISLGVAAIGVAFSVGEILKG